MAELTFPLSIFPTNGAGIPKLVVSQALSKPVPEQAQLDPVDVGSGAAVARDDWQISPQFFGHVWPVGQTIVPSTHSGAMHIGCESGVGVAVLVGKTFEWSTGISKTSVVTVLRLSPVLSAR